MGRRTAEWLLAIAAEARTKVQIGFDYSTDFELMADSIRVAGLWEQVKEVVYPTNINSITGTTDGERSAESCFLDLSRRSLERHHALADALALRSAYIEMMKTKV